MVDYIVGIQRKKTVMAQYYDMHTTLSIHIINPLTADSAIIELAAPMRTPRTLLPLATLNIT